ncbi:MAG: hypothetical protein Q9218_005154 [Villophora microphyllina]
MSLQASDDDGPASSIWPDHRNQQPARVVRQKRAAPSTTAPKPPKRKQTEMKLCAERVAAAADQYELLSKCSMTVPSASTEKASRVRAAIESVQAELKSYANVVGNQPLRYGTLDSQGPRAAVVSLTDQYCELTKNHINMQSELLAKTSEKHAMEAARLDQQQAKNREVKSERDDLSKANGELARQLLELRRECKQLKKDKASLEKRERELDEVNVAQSQANEKLKSHVESLQGQVSKLTEQSENALGKYHNANAHVKRCKADLDTGRVALKRAEESEAAHCQREDELEHRIQSLTVEVAELQAKADRFQNLYASMASNLKSTVKAARDLKKENAGLRNQDDNHRRLRRDNARDYEELQARYHTLETESGATLLAKDKAISDNLAAKRTLERSVDELRYGLKLRTNELGIARKETLQQETRCTALEEEKKKAVASGKARIKALDARCKDLKGRFDESTRDLERLHEDKTTSDRRMEALDKTCGELGRDLRVARQETDALQGEVDRSKAAVIAIENEHGELKSRMHQEQDHFISDLRPLLNITFGIPQLILGRLGISQHVVFPPSHGCFGGYLHPSSIVCGRLPTSFHPNEQRMNLAALPPLAGYFDYFLREIHRHIIKLCLCVDDGLASSDVVLLLWDIWGNLESCVLTNEQISQIAGPLASLLDRVFQAHARDHLPDLVFWLAGQVVGFLSHCRLAHLVQAPMTLNRRGCSEGPLLAAGRCRMSLGTDPALVPSEVPGLFLGIRQTADRFPSFCQYFSAEMDSHTVEACVYHLPNTKETLWAIQMKGGECLLWHGEEGSCEVVEQGFALWVRLIRPAPLEPIRLFPVAIEDRMEDWLVGRFSKIRLEASGTPGMGH